MYDGIRIKVLARYTVFVKNLQKNGLQVNPKSHEVQYADGRPTYMRVEKWGKSVIVRGSMHKFYLNGRNDNTFTFRQAMIAIIKLHALFNIPWDSRIIRLEVGFNLWAKDPISIIDDAVLCDGHTRAKRDDDFDEIIDSHHYAYWKFVEKKTKRNNYIIVLYIKGDKLVRFEIKAHHLCKVFPFIKTLRDLMSEEVFIACQDILFDRMNKMDFAPLSEIQSMPADEAKKWWAYREETVWGKWRKQNRSKVSRERKKLNKQFEITTWRSILLEEMREEAAAMLSDTEPATDSQDRLVWESVACDNEACDATDTANVGGETSSPRTHTSSFKPRGAVGRFLGTAPLQANSASSAHKLAVVPSARGPPLLFVHPPSAINVLVLGYLPSHGRCGAKPAAATNTITTQLILQIKTCFMEIVKIDSKCDPVIITVQCPYCDGKDAITVRREDFAKCQNISEIRKYLSQEDLALLLRERCTDCIGKEIFY
jgi:hypothetical protein